MPWTLIADGMLAVLLLATLFYVRRFSARLEVIRAGRSEFEKLIADLTKSTDQAASHLHQFKVTAETACGDLQARTDRAQGLAAEFGRIGDDLKLLAERAEGAANRLETTIARSRQSPAAAPAPVAAPVAPVPEFPDDESDHKISSLSALSGMR